MADQLPASSAPRLERMWSSRTEAESPAPSPELCRGTPRSGSWASGACLPSPLPFSHFRPQVCTMSPGWGNHGSRCAAPGGKCLEPGALLLLSIWEDELRIERSHHCFWGRCPVEKRLAWRHRHRLKHYQSQLTLLRSTPGLVLRLSCLYTGKPFTSIFPGQLCSKLSSQVNY